MELQYLSKYPTKHLSCIYKITSPSGKIYIGKTINLRSRIWSYNSLLKTKKVSQGLLLNSFKKYGIDVHNIEVIEVIEKEKLCEREIYYIDFFKSLFPDNPKGLNLTKGGEGMLGRKHTEETKEKIRRKATGRKASAETKIKMSNFRKGIPKTKEWLDLVRGKKPSREIVEKRIKAMKTFPVVTKEMIEKAAEVCKKPIRIYKNNIFIGEFKSVKEGAVFINKTPSTVCNYLKGKTKSKEGYICEYI